MQNAADAAALAGALALGNSPTATGPVLAAIDEYAIAQNGAASYTAKWMVNRLPGPAIVAGGSPPANTTGIQVTAVGSSPAFFAGLFGFNQMTAAATAGGEYRPVDVVILVGRPNNVDDDSCSFRNAFLPGQACYQLVAGKPLGAETFQGKVSSKSCPLCMGVWTSADSKCHVATATGPLMDPAPAGCNVTNAAGCAACKGVWTTPTQPINNATSAAKAFVPLNNPTVTRLSVVQYYGTCGDRGNPPLTSTYSLVLAKLNLSAGGQPSNVACALQAALNEFALSGRPGASKFILVFSDGITNVFLTNPAVLTSGDKTTCKECTYPGCCPKAVEQLGAAVTRAVTDNVHISVVEVGSVFDEAFLRAIADGTGGLYRGAGASPVSLTALQEIHTHMVKDYSVGLTQ